MNKLDWLLLLTVTIPIIPAVLKELRLWSVSRRQAAQKKGFRDGDPC